MVGTIQIRVESPKDAQFDECCITKTIPDEKIWWGHLIAGALAGTVSRTCTAPLDRLKVFLQVHSTFRNHYNIFSATKYLYQEGGVKSFWRGNGINVIKIAPESAFKFMTYEQMKRIIQQVKGRHRLSPTDRVLAGSSAGAISITLIYPLEVLKTRLALRSTKEPERGMINYVRKMYKNEGFSCFYRSYFPSLLGIIPSSGIDLAIYETLKKNYMRKHPELTEPGVLVFLACGACSSTCGQLASYPLALVRTRLQAGIKLSNIQSDTMIGQFRYILQNEGFVGLYRGITPNFMKVILAYHGWNWIIKVIINKHATKLYYLKLFLFIGSFAFDLILTFYLWSYRYVFENNKED